MEYSKVKSVAKEVRSSGPALDALILKTMKTIADVVGATLGPGGRPVLIERYEHGLPPFLTKDGVTVFRALGFPNATEHCIMEVARDASIRTATEAGDGTTTATILSEAIVRNTKDFCKRNQRVSPQRVMRRLEAVFRANIEPVIRSLSTKADLEDEGAGRDMLLAVARVSANGDADLAKAVMECFDVTGDEGNVTIVESAGASHYEVEEIDGFAIGVGYDRSAGKFCTAFINDPGTQRCVLNKPVFLLYHGRLSEIQTIKLLMESVGSAWQNQSFNHNVVVVATGFSESVIANLAANFSREDTINVVPLLVPESPQSNGQLQFLQDLQAVVGARILDPVQAPAENATIEDLGPGVEMFEASRFRSSVIGHVDDTLLDVRISQLKNQAKSPESELDGVWLRERIAKLAGGIAKLKVVGSSNGEMKEKRDRAEDAVCAVRGAIQNGCLPAGAWTLLKLCETMPHDEIIDNILRPAFLAPFERLMLNCGITEPEEAQAILGPILEALKTDHPVVYDFLEQKHVDPFKDGLLDSTPAVLEAVRTAISNAGVLGTMGATVVFMRDGDLERSEAKATASWMRALDGPSNDE